MENITIKIGESYDIEGKNGVIGTVTINPNSKCCELPISPEYVFSGKTVMNLIEESGDKG